MLAFVSSTSKMIRFEGLLNESTNSLTNNLPISYKALACVKNHLKEGGLFMLDCFNPIILYIVENEKGQAVIAEYTTDDSREVLIK